MKCKRREFMGLVASSAVTFMAPLTKAASQSAAREEVLEAPGGQITLTRTGEIVSLRTQGMELVDRRLGDNHPRIVILGKRLDVCDHPTVVRREGSRMIFQYELAEPYPFTVDYEVEILDLGTFGASLRQKVGIRSTRKLNVGVEILLPRNIHLPGGTRKVFVPLKNGIGRKQEVQGLDNDEEYVFQLAGGFHPYCRPQMLAIPLVDEYADGTDLHLTFCADPYFTSYFRLPYQDKAGQFHCIYSGEVGMQDREERSIYTVLHRRGFPGAMEAFYRTSLHDVKPGPDWLHEVAMIDFDYLSDNGQGWFADIDKLAGVVKPADRAKILLTLHGWYDYVGRYTYDLKTRAFDKQWTVFANARGEAFQAYGDAPDLGWPYRFRRKSLEKVQPVAMSHLEVHRRIQYARSKGFRVALYYADGLTACDGAPGGFDPSTVLSWGGWMGPDTKGKSYIRNPLHPSVRAFYKDYMQALLNEYGKEVDVFVWDESYVIDPGQLGTEAAPGYADRAFMKLFKEVTALVESANPQAALLNCDMIGWLNFTRKAPYALVTHGTFQDSHCRPEAWSFGLFPNFRNVLWSCNWAPVSWFDFTKYGVETFDVPVAISNGSFGDDIGVSEMTPEQLQRTLDLFEKRKTRRMQIGWVEEDGTNLTYLGRPVKYKYSF